MKSKRIQNIPKESKTFQRRDNKVADIAARMEVSPKYAGEYRRRLIEQGIIGERGHGKVGFEIPMIRLYLQNKLS